MARRNTAIPQAAALACHDGRVCLITARSGRGWGIPKGRLEPGKSETEIALQEAWEEAGLIGYLNEDPVGAYEYEKAGQRYRVNLYFMEVTEIKATWHEMHCRRRDWAILAHAAEQVYQPGLRTLLRQLAASESFFCSR